LTAARAFPDEFRDRIFEKFSQADAPTAGKRRHRAGAQYFTALVHKMAARSALPAKPVRVPRFSSSSEWQNRNRGATAAV
jgi:hypothetical protein